MNTDVVVVIKEYFVMKVKYGNVPNAVVTVPKYPTIANATSLRPVAIIWV